MTHFFMWTSFKLHTNRKLTTVWKPTWTWCTETVLVAQNCECWRSYACTVNMLIHSVSQICEKYITSYQKPQNVNGKVPTRELWWITERNCIITAQINTTRLHSAASVIYYLFSAWEDTMLDKGNEHFYRKIR